MSEKIREAFELWARHELGYCAGVKADGTYYIAKINDMWQAWQASRSALVVELPGAIWCSLAYHEAINDVKEALDDAGVGYR